MLKRRTQLALATATVLTALLGPGCSASREGATPDASVASDGAALGMPDAQVPTTSDAGATGENSDIACADFLDDDRNGATDCADRVACGTRAICCVGATDADCCTPPMTLDSVLDLSTCAGGVVSVCAAGMSAFGSPLPTLTSMRDDGGCSAGTSLAPQGSDRSDAGLLAMATLDTTTSTVAIESTLGVTLSASSSLDAIAVGLTDQAELVGASIAHVRPVVAIVVSATDQTLRAVAGDVAFPTHPLSSILTTGCSELDVRIATRPNGTFDALYRVGHTGAWTTFETARPYGVSPSAHVVVYGRSTNPSVTGVHAWVRSVSVARTVCDVIDPIRTTTGAFTTLPGTHAVHSVSRVGALAVYEMDGSIYVAGVDGTSHLQPLGRTGTEGDRILAPGAAAFMAAAVLDPELVGLGENHRLFFTGVSETGVRSIGYLDFDANVLDRVNESIPRLLVSPDEVAAISVDGPAYFETTSPAMPDGGALDGGMTVHRWVVFRAFVDGAHTELRAAELAGDNTLLGNLAESRDITTQPAQFFTAASPLHADQAIYANRIDDVGAFDQDEIASPELALYHGVTRVFFAARHGARWSIGMLRSPDFAHFELAYPDAVLAGSGAGFDAVSVSDPDVSIDAMGRLSLYYTATDGTSTQPGLATQEVPTP